MTQRESFNEKGWEDREEGNPSKQAQGPKKPGQDAGRREGQRPSENVSPERKTDIGRTGGKPGEKGPSEKRADTSRGSQQKGQQPRRNTENE